MSEVNIIVDAAQVIGVFKRAPEAAVRRLNNEIESAAVESQRLIRKASPTHDGAYRRSVTYKLYPAELRAEIGPRVNYAKWVEEGSRPHWTSVKEGTPLRKWADDKNINPYAVQRAVAKKGTKAQWVVQRVYNFNHRRLESEVISGMARFAREVNSGAV